MDAHKQNQEKPLVSVICPTYNRAWTLEKAIDSVLSQDYPNTELIVINDGSTDDTSDLLASCGERVIVIDQENKGVSAARNAGIRSSRGELIALIDSDDQWDKRKISCQVQFFVDHPNAMICQTDEIWIRNGKRVNPKKKHQKPSGMIFEPSLHLCLVSPSAVMMRKQLFRKKGLFKEDFVVCEDYDLWLRISFDTPVYLIDKPYTIKNGGHEDQLSSMHSQDRYRILSLQQLIDNGALNGKQAALAAGVLKKKCLIYANGCMKRNKIEEGQYYLKLAEQYAI